MVQNSPVHTKLLLVLIYRTANVKPCFNTIEEYFLGTKFKFESPYGDELPAKGFDPGEDTFQPPPSDSTGLNVNVEETSQRLHLLSPFSKWDGKDITDALVLIKVRL